MSDPLVSILIPFRNTAAFLPECLHSVRTQEYKHWEVLAVNDHSTDRSGAILRHFSQLDPRIHVFENQGKGIIPALRTAYGFSRGTMITRMDSDDIMAPDRLSAMVQSLCEQGPEHLAVGQVRYFSDRGISDGYTRYEAWLNGLTAQGQNYSEIYKECPVPSPCWMAYRQDLDAAGAFSPDRYPEDYDLTFRFYETGLQCIPYHRILHYWRDYDSRTSRTSPHYAMNYFLDIKLHYFLKLDRNPDRSLAVWGAGNKGKTIARSLRDQNLPFYWLCDNPKKIGKSIYGIPLRHYTELKEIPDAQSIITVANEEAQTAIRHYFDELASVPMHDYFFFC